MISDRHSFGGGNGDPLQYSCLENPMHRGAWWAAVHGVAKSWTWLCDFTFTFMHWRRKWQPTPVFLPGESQGRGAWWAAVYGVTQSQTQLKRLSISSSRHSLLLNNICMISLFYPFTINLPISLYLMSFLCTAYMWIIYIFFILWYQCAIIYLNIHLLKYIWVASGFEVLWIHYKHSYTVLCLHFKPHFSGINPQEWNFWVIW